MSWRRNTYEGFEKQGALSIQSLKAFLLILLMGTGIKISGQENSLYTEKIFLHTDREYYISGEELQFSAYLNTNDGSEVRSRILYVELKAAGSNYRDSRIFRINQNPLAGSFLLPDSLKSGSYILSAYTNWHRNFDNRFAFRKELTLINRFGNSDEHTREHHLTQNAVLNSHTDLVVTDSSGYFRIDLPSEPKFRSADLRCNIFHQGRLTGQYFFAKPVSGYPSLSLEKRLLPQGILKLEINASKELLGSTFILNRKDMLNLTILTDKQKYYTRSPVRISLGLNGNIPGKTKASLSVSVFPVPESYPLNAPAQISDWFGMYSELTANGSPGSENIWIFDELNNHQLKYPFESHGRIISGKVVDEKTGSPVANSLVFFSFIDTLSYLDYHRTDSLGNFYFSVPPGLNIDPVILQIWEAPPGIENCRIEFDETEIPIPPGPAPYEGISSEKLSETFTSQVRIFEINSLFSEPVNTSFVNGFTGHHFESMYKGYNLRVYPSDFVPLNNFTEIVREILPGVKLKNEKGEISVRIMDELRNIYYDDDPLVLVNGMPLKNFHFLLNYSSEDIERIDIVRRLFAVGSLIFPGVLSIELKEGLSTEQLTDNKIYRVRNEIITQVTTPQYPDYENHVQRKSRYPDLRNTLFWLPDLKMESPEQEISFYTSDISGKYRIHIEGLVNDTIPVSAFGEFHVETNY